MRVRPTGHMFGDCKTTIYVQERKTKLIMEMVNTERKEEKEEQRRMLILPSFHPKTIQRLWEEKKQIFTALVAAAAVEETGP